MSKAERVARAALHAIWVGVVPALLAALVVRFLVPPSGTGFPGVVSRLAHAYPIPLAMALFLLVSAVARYWEGRWLGAPERPSSGTRNVTITIGGVAVAVAVALGVRARVVDSYQVLSGSMLPTLEPDDRIAGLKLSRGALRSPRRGEVVLFQSSSVAAIPQASGAPVPDVLVKRVIGLPGDRVSMRGGVPVINGWQVPTCTAGQYLFVLPDGEGGSLRGVVFVEFLEDRAYLTVHAVPMPAFQGEYEVAPGEVFVLGDNRANSLDSRSYGRGAGGGVPLDAVEARADWFLVGTHRSGDSDLTRLFRPIDGLEHFLHAEGVNASELERGIARCLEHRPADTHVPPPPLAASADGARPATDT